jgi:hypothetical protein
VKSFEKRKGKKLKENETRQDVMKIIDIKLKRTNGPPSPYNDLYN